MPDPSRFFPLPEAGTHIPEIGRRQRVNSVQCDRVIEQRKRGAFMALQQPIAIWKSVDLAYNRLHNAREPRVPREERKWYG